MELSNFFHMNVGEGEYSYANNSGLQKAVVSKTWPVLDETLKDMFIEKKGFPKCMKMADLGCASGPNTLFVISHIMDTIKDLCKNSNLSNLPQVLEVFLNDLPQNDFNNLFKLMSDEFSQMNYEKERKLECFVYGVPGSFYGKLFPNNTLHFAYSSYSVHWLSQVPEGLGKNNKENIYITTTSPPQVCELYAKQFARDFLRLLSFRAKEITFGGRMVLAFIGRSFGDPSSKDESQQYLTLLGEALSDMVAQGLIKEDNLYSFNVPIYMPCQQEVEAIINDEGSFNLDKMDVVRVQWDVTYDDYDVMVFDKYKSAKRVAGNVRAFMEPKLAFHFGSSIVDGVFDIYVEKLAEHLSKERSSYFTMVISLLGNSQKKFATKTFVSVLTHAACVICSWFDRK